MQSRSGRFDELPPGSPLARTGPLVGGKGVGPLARGCQLDSAGLGSSFPAVSTTAIRIHSCCSRAFPSENFLDSVAQSRYRCITTTTYGGGFVSITTSLSLALFLKLLASCRLSLTGGFPLSLAARLVQTTYIPMGCGVVILHPDCHFPPVSCLT
jgi:hypothetical protein